MRLLVIHGSRAPVLLVDLALMKARSLSVASTRKPSLSNADRAPLTYYSGRRNYQDHAVVLMTTPLYGHNRLVVIDAI
jgi:hypothetical protein